MKVDLIIPSSGSESTILKTIKSVAAQDFPINHIFIINNDQSEYIKKEVIKYLLEADIEHSYFIPDRQMGLAEKYNIAINKSLAEIIVTVHSDVVMVGKSELRKLINPFFASENIVAVGHIVEHPIEIWQSYPFYQKCLFSRLLFKEFAGIDGKFDAFSRVALAEIGNFDHINFKDAGEDGDVIYRLNTVGLIINSDARIIHLHSLDTSFGLRSYIFKHYQYARAQGVLLRKCRVKGLKEFIHMFHREVMFIICLIPDAFLAGATLIIIHGVMYNLNVYKYSWRDYRIFILPFVHFITIISSFYGAILGFASGKQK